MTLLARPASAGCLLAIVGCAAPPPPAPPQLVYCAELHRLYFYYHPNVTQAHNGQRARAELAMRSCWDGDHAAGIEELSELLRRHRVPAPPPGGGG